MPSISVILPTRDRRALLDRAVASVLVQTERDFELLIVDNNGDDPPLRAMAPAPAWLQDPRVKVIRATGAANAAAARNPGLEHASGEWIAFLDDDDAYRPQKLAAQRALARQTGAPLVLCGAAYRLRGRTRVRYASRARLRGDALFLDAGYSPPFLFHRRTRLRFDETLFAGEDALYAQALLAEFGCNEVPVAAEPLVDVYQDQPMLSRTNVRGEASWCAARKTWRLHGRRYSETARRIFLLRARLTRAKWQGRTREILRLAPALVRIGGIGQIRFAANALLISAGCWRGRWVT